jgi:hypothetical protein
MAVIALNRKGVFFTIMALLLIAFLIATQQSHLTAITATKVDTTAAHARATVMNNYADAFETQAANSLALAGYFTLQNLSSRIAQSRTFVSNMNASARFCMNNKTAPHNCLNASQTINATLDQLTTLASSDLGITTTYDITNVWVTEERPFEVIFWMNISYNISDPFASWRVENRTISAPVDVTGIQDPLYAYLNASNITRTRNFSQTGIRPMQFTNTSFYSYYTNRSYIANAGNNTPGELTYGPSVLQRYAGNFTNGSSCCGIESVMHISDLNFSTYSDPRRANWSFVDFQFVVKDTTPAFRCDQNENAKFNYNTLPSPHYTLRLDSDRFSNVYYNISNHANYTCATN